MTNQTSLLSFDQLAQHVHSGLQTTSAPGRVQSYLKGSPRRLPHSCTLYVYKDLADALTFTSEALRAGSGVKAIFAKDFKLDEVSERPGLIYLRLSESHPDYEAFAPIRQQLADLHPDYGLDIWRAGRFRWVVQDSMATEPGLAGDFGIQESWAAAWQAIASGQDVELDLTNLRQAGAQKAGGVESSGPASFAEIYVAMQAYAISPTLLNLLKLLGVQNGVILRGGFKRGIVTSMMHSDCELAEDYLAAPVADLAGSHKKGLIVTKAALSGKAAKQRALRAAIVKGINEESLFLQKDFDELGDNYAGTYSNVCVGIALPDRGTCLIWRVNLGAIGSRDAMISAFEEATRAIVSLHVEWHNRVQGTKLGALWRPMESDRQVAIDVFGLANLLKRFGYKYDDFVSDLANYVSDPWICTDDLDRKHSNDSGNIVEWLAAGYRASTELAQAMAKAAGLPSFQRLHTVEPAQSHAFAMSDYNGDTLCRGIWPPFARVVTRGSDVHTQITVNHGAVETIADVGVETVFDLNCRWQELMNVAGLPHCISYDCYEQADLDYLSRWAQSPLLTQYYQFAKAVDQQYARKVVEEVDIFGDEAPVLDPTKPEDVCNVCAE
jgi:hypothetical protein